MLERMKGWFGLNKVDQVSLYRSQLSKDLEVKYIHENICRKNISKSKKQYNSPKAEVTGISESNKKASVVVMRRTREKRVEAEVREAKGEGCKV